MKIYRCVFVLIVILAVFMGIKAQTPDPNFHIYLCLGQSNMEGQGEITEIDILDSPERFLMMPAVDFDNPQRTLFEWSQAIPPLARQTAGLGPVDWFGRTMAENLPADVRVGVIVVAVGGARIEYLSKEYNPASLEKESEWFKGMMNQYDGCPYRRLLECARKAQKVGVIKGMLLHQGCSDTGDKQWPKKVKKLYDDLLTDLDLNPQRVPLLAGEVVRTEMGGKRGEMNKIINTLPLLVRNAYIIPASGLSHCGDNIHFDSQAYRILGERYASRMLRLLGINDPALTFEPENTPRDITYNVYTLQGVKVLTTKDRYDFSRLPRGIYIVNNVKFFIP